MSSDDGSSNLRYTVSASFVTGTPPENVTVAEVSDWTDPESLMTPLKLAEGVHEAKEEKPDPVN